MVKYAQRGATKLVNSLGDNSYEEQFEGTGIIQSGEKDSQGRPYRSLQLHERKL